MMTLAHRGSPAIALVTFLSASLTGCGDEAASPPEPAEIRPSGGSGQVGPVGAPLPSPIVAEVLDAEGAPIPGVRITWSVEGDGRIFPVTTGTTDANGRAGARWVLGGRAGPNFATAGVTGVAPATFTALAESPDEVPLGEIRVLHPTTYDGSGQVVHPDFAQSVGTSFDFPRHLALTPYPFGDASHENPSVFVEEGRPDRWTVQPGTPAPVVRPAAGYLSDPDLVFDPEAGDLRLYYRQATTENTILLVRSADGVRWGEPAVVARAPSHEIVSPAVVRRGAGDWFMWSVNSGPAGCGALETTVELRRSTDGVAWSEPERVNLEQPGLWPWHLDVQWITERNEFWGIYNVKLASTCTTPAVFLATSPDGMNWQVVSRPVITKGRVPELQDIVYRSTMAYDGARDAITFWYSGAQYSGGRYRWSAAVERRSREEVFAESLTLYDSTIYTPAPAPLEDWP